MTPTAEYSISPRRKDACPLCGQLKMKHRLRCMSCWKAHRKAIPHIDQPDNDTLRYIPLTQGKIAKVDVQLYEIFNQWKWYAAQDLEGDWYAVRFPGIKMHRDIVGISKGDPREVDHQNGDTLDNRGGNLRPCEKFQNAFNRKLYKNNTSGFKGLGWRVGKKKWEVTLRFRGKSIYVGCFSDRIEGAKAYDKKATELFGIFARLNFPSTLQAPEP